MEMYVDVDDDLDYDRPPASEKNPDLPPVYRAQPTTPPSKVQNKQQDLPPPEYQQPGYLEPLYIPPDHELPAISDEDLAARLAALGVEPAISDEDLAAISDEDLAELGVQPATRAVASLPPWVAVHAIHRLERNDFEKRGEDGPRYADGTFKYEIDMIRAMDRERESYEYAERERLNDLMLINEARNPLMRLLNRVTTRGIIVSTTVLVSLALMTTGIVLIAMPQYGFKNPIALTLAIIGSFMVFIVMTALRHGWFED